MTEPELSTKAVRSIPPKEVIIAICLEAVIFLRLPVAADIVYVHYANNQRHPVSVGLILLLLTATLTLILCGLWSRQNWVRWLTVILNVASLYSDLDHGPGWPNDHSKYLVYCLIAIRVVATVILLLPTADHWYRRKAE
jgi:hypothetical protein